MITGAQLTAPDGFGPLLPGETYYLLRHHAASPRTTLCRFEPKFTGSETTGPWKTHFILVPRLEFEAALMEKYILPAQVLVTRPPWLKAFEGIELSVWEEFRQSRKVSYRTRAERRYLQIDPLLKMLSEVLGSDDPYRFICEYARRQSPSLVGARLALWMCCYIAFGNDIDSLTPSFSNIGTWARTAGRLNNKKLGRRALHKGTRSGHSAIPLAEEIEKSYLKRAALGVPLASIYRQAIECDFRCRVQTDARGVKTFYHPASKPFPTYQQYKYWVGKRIGLERVQRIRFGEARYRSKLAANRGTFIESCANLLERCEQDAYYLSERPRTLVAGGSGPRLVVCRIVCTTSGFCFGIGFAYDDERQDAYRAALFCAAIGKAYFLSLFGLDYEEADWPSQGLPPHLIVDRGPGAHESLLAPDVGEIAVRELAPSWSGQSKAVVESSHPRTTALEGAPSYIQSDLNVIELARREVMRVIADNHSSDATNRLTPEMIAADVKGNPTAVYRYLDGRGRNSGVPMDFNRAVRAFLQPVQFTLSIDGLFLECMRFDSDALLETGLRQRLAKGQSVTIPGYIYPLCVRTTWVDIDGRLVQVEAMLPIRDDVEQTYLSLRELKEHANELRRIKSEQREHAHAAVVEQAVKFKEVTGKQWHAGKRKGGAAPKRSQNGAERFAARKPTTRSRSA